ncbi:MAG TPA: hypothetical protein VHD90_02750 [Phototrophicaceae bacterium]|nr:hypothetical protein [Phototrophicaceae bacterium]
MKKRWVVIGLLALLVALNVNVIAAQDATEQATEQPTEQATAEATAQAIPASLAQQMAALEQITQQLRGLKAKNEIAHAFPTRQQTIAYLQASYDREFPQAKFDQLKEFYVALGLLPANIDLRTVYLSLLDSQVAGFYDPDTKTMNVIPVVGNSVGGTLSFTEQIIYVHEFTHALQDQYFDLNTLESPEVEAIPDESLAITSLVEGDATSTMTVYAQDVEMKNPLAAFSLLAEGLQAGDLTLPPGMPPALVNELLFPYEQGLDFVVALYKHGGEDAINAAFRNPPTTSEQIMHPDKYIAGEGAQTVALSDQTAALGSGWEQEWDIPLGEFYLQEYLATEIPQDAATQAAAGWGGDHFRVYYDKANNQVAFALKIAWDTPADQAEFEAAYTQYSLKRFGKPVYGDGCWSDTSGAVCLISGSSGDLITSAPTFDQANALVG